LIDSRYRYTVLLSALLLATGQPALAHEADSPTDYVRLLAGSTADRLAALERVEVAWQPGSAVMLAEVLVFLRDAAVQRPVLELLESKTGQELGFDVQAWFDWFWQQEPLPHPHYGRFKSLLYRNIDPHFAAYFSDESDATVRLDEVRWGGVRQDGIPPLRAPGMIEAEEATYLADADIVFALEIEGDRRAYPQRILAWHEMFVDEVGGVRVAGVYCTLCGTAIVYETVHEGVEHELGTSGFLYRSNKLMYDRATQSLWNTIWGEPAVGPLVGKGITLTRRSVVTTTWGEWRRRHPDTLVLSIDTGHERDYSEGAAYRDYFATDELMFNVPKLDRRLKNKAEVLALVFPEYPNRPLAFSQRYLLEHPLAHDRVGNLELVVLTDRSGANRVYATGGVTFESWDQESTVIDADGGSWTLTEASLGHADGRRLTRLPAQRAFWFGWYAAYPQTRLID